MLKNKTTKKLKQNKKPINELNMHLQGENQLVKYHVSNHNSISNESEMMACSI